MGIYETKTAVATIQFTLDVNKKYTLTVCAYGDMWEEKFNNWDALESYVIKEWGFTDEQTKGLYKEAYVHCIKKITPKEADYIIETRMPRGLFYLENEKSGYTGIDNRDGDAWTEDFKSVSACRNWLKK